MNSIAFIDTEIEPKSQKILDIGGVKDDGNRFHSNSINDFITFLRGAEYVCGHNIFNHDLKYIQKAVIDAGINTSNVIDTLFLSPMLFLQSHIMLCLKTTSFKRKTQITLLTIQ